MKIFGLKNCDTCRKAAKALPQAELVDIREHPLPDDLLERAHDMFGAALLNTRSTTWRGLSETERQCDALDLIRSHPALMKRPLIDDGDTLYLGWSQGVQGALI
ncbi:arsenate reductase family protein [Roseovarius sp. S4756]|uniref:arsenate reductase family protein n=1 Tax=Roseovarius maritimus TaxID=3342637 RepID=UPI00372C42D6